MNHPLRVAVADDEPIMQMYLEETLSEFGHEVVAAAQNGFELVEQCRREHPDLVVTDIMMPGLDGFRAAKEICRDVPVPVVFITGYDEKERAVRAESECVLVYLVKPIGETELRKAIDLVMQRFEHFKVLCHEVKDPRKALADRPYIEKAKNVLMKRHDLDDREAFDRLRERAREKDQDLLAAAMDILTATDRDR